MTTILNRSRLINVCWALLAVVTAPSLPSIQAEPVTGWVFTNTNNPGGAASFTGGSAATNSPVTLDADGETIVANFTPITLANADVLTLTGSVTFDSPLANAQFRFGLFNAPAPAATGVGSNYVGFSASAPASQGAAGAQLAAGNGTSSNPFTTTGGVSTNLVNFTGNIPGAPAANTTLDYMLQVTRIGDTASLFASITDGDQYDVTWQIDDVAPVPASFSYNSVAFLMGGSLNATLATYGDIDVTLTQLQTIAIEVNTDTGIVKLVNNGSTDFNFNSYEILSELGSLDATGWSSLDSQNIDAVDGPDMGPTAGDSVGEGWNAAINADEFALTEVFLTGGTLLAQGASITLGKAFTVGAVGDLEFNFTEVDGTALVPGIVNYVTGLDGDYNADGHVDAADYTVWRDTLGSTGRGLAADGNADEVIDGLDYELWRSNFGQSLTPAGSLSAAPVPEPASALLMLPLMGLALRRFRR